MTLEKPEIRAAAEFLCLQLHPPFLRSAYARDIRVYYHAEEIVYVLQALSTGMTGLFIGLLTNYLYDKTKEPDRKNVDLETLIAQQTEHIKKLERMLAREADAEFRIVAARQSDLHRQTIARIQDADPTITAMVEDVLRQLGERGSKALSDEVDKLV